MNIWKFSLNPCERGKSHHFLPHKSDLERIKHGTLTWKKWESQERDTESEFSSGNPSANRVVRGDIGTIQRRIYSAAVNFLSGVEWWHTVRMVSLSQGRMVQRSISSQETSRLSWAIWATSLSTWTWVPQPISVTSLPGTSTECSVNPPA